MADTASDIRGKPVVLVVDDDASMRMLSMAAIEAAGLKAAEARDGLEAVESLELLRPDLIVLDIMMPGMDGFETCARLREQPSGYHVPILIVTGRDDVESINQAYEAGATDFVTKPINWTIFGHRVRYMLRAGRALADLSEARIAAEAAGRAKSEFLANMSHEIRTPLTAILGYIELILESEPSAEERTEFLRVVHRNGRHLLAILNDVLDTAKLEAGMLRVERIPRSPRGVVADVISLLRSHAVEKKIALTVDPRGPIPDIITTDPTRLRQILLNLAGNALKFTSKGGVTIRLQMATPADAPNPILAFEVIDSGIGLSEDEQDKVFEAFAQADSSVQRKFGGTGLGLTISKRLAEMLGGDITVQSAPGRGSTFRVTIETGPLEDARMIERPWERDTETVDTPHPAELGRLSGRILLAEDGPDNRRLICTVLRKAGLQVDVAENGQEAVEFALAARDRDEPHDLILMDVQMPILDGLTAAGRLRDAGYEQPIIALTAHARESDRARCIQAGCDEFASKPINRSWLLRLLEHYLKKEPGVVAP